MFETTIAASEVNCYIQYYLTIHDSVARGEKDELHPVKSTNFEAATAKKNINVNCHLWYLESMCS